MNTNEHPSPEQLTDYVHRELPEQQDAVVHAHLASCALCTEAHEMETRLGEVLREHARSQERELPPGFAQRIVDAAIASDAQHDTPWWEAFARALRPAIAIPAVAVIALFVYLAVGSHQGAVQSATIDAATYIDNHAALATDMPFAEGSMLPTEFDSESGGGPAR